MTFEVKFYIIITKESILNIFDYTTEFTVMIIFGYNGYMHSHFNTSIMILMKYGSISAPLFD